MPDRRIAPPVQAIRDIRWIPPDEIQLDNGRRMFLIRDDTLEATRVDFIFPGGAWAEHKPLVCNTAIETLREGTGKRHAAEIAELFDYYGSYIITYSNRDYAGISLYTLTRYASKTFEILEEIIRNPAFPEKEIHTYLSKQQQTFIIESEKVSYQSSAAFLEQVFGSSHPYGRKIKTSHFTEITPDDLKVFHRQNLYCNNCFIILAGNIPDTLIKEVNKRFGTPYVTCRETTAGIYSPVRQAKRTQLLIPKKDAVQSAITIGMRSITRRHEDYPVLSFVSTLLGGYFGSRLMKKIREKKGYTYDISSALSSLRFDGYFSIQTEVGINFCKPALKEIYREVRNLRKNPPGTEEISLVCNYITGSLLQSLDGTMARADMVKMMITTETNFDYLNSFVKKINAITTKDIRNITDRYINPDLFTEVVAGIC